MDRRKVIFGLILIIFGLMLLGRSLDWFDFSVGELIRTIVPVGLILLGIWLIVRKKRQDDVLKAHAHYHGWSTTGSATSAQSQYRPPPEDAGPRGSSAEPGASGGPGGPHASPAGGEVGSVKYSKLLGDLFIDCSGVNLQRVEVSAGIGDVEIKLHGGRLAAGLNRLIVSGFVGDIRLFVPPGLPYYVHCSNFIGDVEAGGQKAGGFSNTVETQTSDYDTAQSKLYIAANNFIGDIKLFVM